MNRRSAQDKAASEEVKGKTLQESLAIWNECNYTVCLFFKKTKLLIKEIQPIETTKL